MSTGQLLNKGAYQRRVRAASQYHFITSVAFEGQRALLLEGETRSQLC